MIIQMSTLGRNGRFANQIFQYFFLKLVKDELGHEIRYPPWLGNQFFGIPQSLELVETEVKFGFERLTGRNDAPADDFLRLNKIISTCGANAIDITGYFQYHTRFLFKYKELFLKTFSINPTLIQQVKNAIQKIKTSNQALISVHVRAGDYLLHENNHNYFWSPPMDSISITLNNLLLADPANIPLIYLASDDIEYSSQQLKKDGISYVTKDNLFKGLNEVSSIAMDFISLVLADKLLISNSSYSFAAAMLNTQAKIFLRPQPIDSKYISFDPWNEHVLLSKQSDIFQAKL